MEAPPPGARLGTGVHLKWDNICYDVQENKEPKRILHEISGSVAPGEMVAIMGPSGCGKSSLLNILARRKTEQDGATGIIEINGSPIPANFQRLSGYVTQDFQFFEFLTVRETLTISAKLTLASSVSSDEKKARVEKLLADLDLTKCADTMIGSPTNVLAAGISGGERRRLCMAMELMNDPPLLFLDEPTSGLDSASALMVMDLLKQQVAKGKTVVCVIHQPRASILPLFDTVLLMGLGKTVYYGPSCDFEGDVSADPLRDFFKEAGHPCPAFENPADHILDIINTTDGDVAGLSPSDPKGDEVKSLTDREKTVDDLVNKYAATDLCKKMYEKGRGGSDVSLPKVTGTSGKYATSWCTQFIVLVGRTMKLKFRDPMSFGTVVSGVIVVSLLEGSIYWQIPDGDWQNRIAGIAMFISFMAFMAFDILMLWPAERIIYLRDQRAGMYSTSAFYIARSIAELPTHLLSGATGGILTYLMYGLNCSILNFILNAGLMIVTSAAVFMFVSSLAKNFEQSNQLAMPILTILFLFSGFFIPAQKIPAMWKWVPDVNFMYYSVNYLVVVEIDSMKSCDGIMGTNISTIDCDFALRGAGFDPEMTLSDVLMCHLWTNLLFRILSYFGLKFCWTGQSLKQRCEA